MMNKHFYLFSLLASLPTYTLAAVDCKTPPTCSELGYTENAADCVGKKTLCPFDTEKAVCIDSPKVGDLKYSLYSSNHNGWLKCDGTQYKISDYQRLYNVIKLNFCHKYTSRTDTSTSSSCKADYFAVPDYRGFFLRGYKSSNSSAVDKSSLSNAFSNALRYKGNYIRYGGSSGSYDDSLYIPEYERLPNITGNFAARGPEVNVKESSGAFESYAYNSHGAGHKNDAQSVGFTFTASKSNPIYDGKHVVPANYATYIFIYAGE